MAKRFRALRLLALLYQILAWMALVGGVLVAIFAVILGVVSGRAGGPSPMVADFPLLNRAVGLAAGIVVAFIIVLAGIIYFVLLYAMSEVIRLGLAIEQNTRETAQYIRGEGTIGPPSDQAADWG